MEDKFVKFRDAVEVDELARTVRDDRVVVLRKSRLTGTVKVRVVEHVSNRRLKKAFAPYVVERVYDELPVDTEPVPKRTKKRLTRFIDRLFRNRTSD